jgi:glucose/arabinose dehydrogenase
MAVVLSAADARAQLRTVTVASGFSLPVAFVQDPVNVGIQFVVQQNGHVRMIRGGTVQPNDFLDLSGSIVSGGEQGLLGMVFSPDTATSGRFFVNFTDRSGNTVVARFKRVDPVTVDLSSRFDLHWNGAAGEAFIRQPFANHNGGNLVFGPDGFLYIGLGDGGSGNDPDNRAQNPNDLLGKMLRIDVNVADSDPVGYRVPPDNPFLDGNPISARGEIWSFGLRNPWRYSFDDPARGGTGALVIGDVGQGSWEEVDYEPANRGGRNYGWRIREGAHNNVTTLPAAFTPLVDPIHEYDHTVGGSITGGYVYRGLSIPSARGRYFFADFIRGRVWSIALSINGTTGEATASGLIEHTAELSTQGALGNISSFAVDGEGEMYLVGYSTGRILRIATVGTPIAPTGLRITPRP